MWVRLLLIFTLIVISLFCWLSLINPSFTRDAKRTKEGGKIASLPSSPLF